jgi:hypothetical protein
MPYIHHEFRKSFDEYLQHIVPNTSGELNYCITKLILNFLPSCAPEWHDAKGTSYRKYSDYNAAIGALECAKLELYRRLISDYEDQKADENGDVYT